LTLGGGAGAGGSNAGFVPGAGVIRHAGLRWEQVDLTQGLLHVRRRKNGNPSSHPLQGPELRAFRRLQRDYPNCPYVFTGERRGPLTDSTVRKMVARAGIVAGIKFPVHPHMLRHAAGYMLANDGQDTFADGTAVVAFGLRNPARIELVIRAWASLYRRQLWGWKPTSAPAELFLRRETKANQSLDEPRYHDFLSDLLPLAALKACKETCGPRCNRILFTTLICRDWFTYSSPFFPPFILPPAFSSTLPIRTQRTVRSSALETFREDASSQAPLRQSFSRRISL